MKDGRGRGTFLLLILLLLRHISGQETIDVEIDVNGETITRDYDSMHTASLPIRYSKNRFGRGRRQSRRNRLGWLKRYSSSDSFSSSYKGSSSQKGIKSSKKSNKSSKSGKGSGKGSGKESGKGTGDDYQFWYYDDENDVDEGEVCWEYYYKFVYLDSIEDGIGKGKGGHGDSSSSDYYWSGKGTKSDSSSSKSSEASGSSKGSSSKKESSSSKGSASWKGSASSKGSASYESSESSKGSLSSKSSGSSKGSSSSSSKGSKSSKSEKSSDDYSQGYGEEKGIKKSFGSGDDFSKKVLVKEKIRCRPTRNPSVDEPSEPEPTTSPQPTTDLDGPTKNPLLDEPTVSPQPTGPTVSPQPTSPTVSPQPTGPAVSPEQTGPTVSPQPTGPTASPLPTGPTSSPLPSGDAVSSPTVSPSPTAPTVSPVPSQIGPTVSPKPSRLDISSAPSESGPTLRPTASPSVSAAPSTSRTPTRFPTQTPTEGPRCITRANTFLCEQRFQQVQPPITKECECYNFCDLTFVGCCDFEAICKIDCIGLLVAGCKPELVSPFPSRAPFSRAPRTPRPTVTARPTSPTTQPSSAPTARCVVGTNLGQCPEVTATQEPVEGCSCYNYCNGRYNGCCDLGQISECQQDCVGTVVAGCELLPAQNATSSPAPSAQNDTSSPAPSITSEPSSSFAPTGLSASAADGNDTIDSDLTFRSDPYTIYVPIYSLHFKLSDIIEEMERSDLSDLIGVTSAYLQRHFLAIYSTTDYDFDDFSTSLLTHERKVELSQVIVKLRSKAIFGSGPTRAPADRSVAQEILNAFSGTTGDGYLGMVQALSRTNIFSSAFYVKVVFEEDKRSDPPRKRTAAAVLVSLASVFAFGAAAVFSYRTYKRHNSHSAELLKDEGTVSLTVSTVLDEMSISILNAPEKRLLDFDSSMSTSWGKNWWEDDDNGNFDQEGKLDEKADNDEDTKLRPENAEYSEPRARIVGDKTRNTISNSGIDPFDPMRLQGFDLSNRWSSTQLALSGNQTHSDDEEIECDEKYKDARKSMTLKRGPGIGGFGQRRSVVRSIRTASHATKASSHWSDESLRLSSASSPPEDYLLDRLRRKEHVDEVGPRDPPIYERVGDRRNVISRKTSRDLSGFRRRDSST